MNPVLIDPDDPNAPDDPKPDCFVSVIVPVEFTGTSVDQLTTHGGIIKEMKEENRTVMIQALIPEHQYAEFASAIKEWTQGRGRVERQANVGE
jgi:translation elongation factor EF-G